MQCKKWHNIHKSCCSITFCPLNWTMVILLKTYAVEGTLVARYVFFSSCDSKWTHPAWSFFIVFLDSPCEYLQQLTMNPVQVQECNTEESSTFLKLTLENTYIKMCLGSLVQFPDLPFWARGNPGLIGKQACKWRHKLKTNLCM